jgi:hypothetical protein
MRNVSPQTGIEGIDLAHRMAVPRWPDPLATGICFNLEYSDLAAARMGMSVTASIDSTCQLSCIDVASIRPWDLGASEPATTAAAEATAGTPAVAKT